MSCVMLNLERDLKDDYKMSIRKRNSKEWMNLKRYVWEKRSIENDDYLIKLM